MGNISYVIYVELGKSVFLSEVRRKQTVRNAEGSADRGMQRKLMPFCNREDRDWNIISRENEQTFAWSLFAENCKETQNSEGKKNFAFMQDMRLSYL